MHAFENHTKVFYHTNGQFTWTLGITLHIRFSHEGTGTQDFPEGGRKN
jgi:hypothetical protein